MGYNNRVYERADMELSRRRSRAQSEQKKRHTEAVKKIPRLLELEKKMADTGIAAVNAITMGEDAHKYINALAEQNLAAQAERKSLLVKAGYPPNFLEMQFVCPKCEDNGLISGIYCDCRATLLRTLAFSELSELSPVSNSTFESFDLDYYPKATDPETGITPYARMSEIYNFCKDYAEDFDTTSPSLFLHGKTGLGKTHLSLAIAGHAVNQGFGVIYGSAQNLLTKLERERFSRGYENKGNAEQSLLECDLLILDDLGAEFSTSFTISAIYNIINTRISREMPVIINTNLTPEELEEKYSQRITSRIIGNYVSLQFCGRDIRQLKKRN
ncbi:MAG TPA: ATP-binding protein [Clostridia bacterium]|nr:ATP-binding protein [Clostridia bacterium]